MSEKARGLVLVVEDEPAIADVIRTRGLRAIATTGSELALKTAAIAAHATGLPFATDPETVRRCQEKVSYVAPGMAQALHRVAAVGRVGLSDREREVLLAWLHTDSKDHVGQTLHIAPATVRTHLQRIRGKYALAGRPAATKAALFARAVEDGLIGLADLCQPFG